MKRKMDAEERERHIRTKEDPHLVGEQAAKEAREERLRRENEGALESEDKRWDWLLAQMSDVSFLFIFTLLRGKGVEMELIWL